MTPAAARRMRRAYDIGANILAAFGNGLTGDTLLRHLHGAPFDLARDDDGRVWRMRLYGIETPPCRSETVAIVTWARMATEAGAMEGATAHSPTG